ncbi:GUN4 domain-containing protein [Nodularia harveyana UHCC-0300]|uniref:GUN4 domain-containing protein n=1 Tax=Nodularia harveyana UHCC-0300 TaxID=2974287 RepID=A0ABU5UFT2_9CYAN|nr:GUN4 domain-containing protein [Nodularia harveyana]MEA5582427.1 GUN4 domain-containing protein [Nodularia harveyana UHCC-0300]
MSPNLDDLILRLKSKFTNPRQVVVIGSTSFWNISTPAICESTGEKLAKLDDILLLTGGVSGIPEALSRSFWRHQKPDNSARVIHIQPQGFDPWEYGENLTAGDTLAERRWILAHLAPVYLLLEGGSGAEQEAQWALKAGAIVIPVGCTGGGAQKLYADLTANSEWVRNQWQMETSLEPWKNIGDTSASVEKIATAIVNLIDQALDQKVIPIHTTATLLTELNNLLAAGNWQVANQITFCLFCEKIPKDLTNPGLIHYKDLHKIPDDILREIDRLWVHYSQGRFGFSVQWQIYYQLHDLDNIEDELEWDEAFAQKVGRPEFLAPYDVNRVNYNLDCPPGHLPWFHWQDYTQRKFKGGGIIGGGGLGWEAIFDLSYSLERCGIISPAGKVWSRAEVIKAISKGERIFSRGNLSGIDLQGLDLSAAYFLNADLSHSNLSNTKLHQANFHSANLYEANLDNTQAKNTCFRKANLEGAIFTNSQLIEVDFSQALAFRARFDYSIWKNVNTSEASYWGALAADMLHYYRQDINPKSAYFWGANFYYTKFNNCNFQNTNASYSNWEKAILKNCDFTGLVTANARLNMTQFVGNNWSESQCLQARLETNNITFFDTETETGKALQETWGNTFPKIMIIDDSCTVRKLLGIAFSKAGYGVFKARDGQDAWENLQAGLTCDFIFCDVEMPRMNGFELLEKVKQDEKLKNIPFAIITSRGQDQMRPNFLDKKFRIVGYFTKPYLEEVLLETVASVLGKNLDSSLSPALRKVPPARFFAIGLNLKQRKSLVALLRSHQEFICHFFPENQVIQPELFTLKLKQRTRKTIHISPSVFSTSQTCTFIPDYLFSDNQGVVGNPINYPLYLVIDINTLHNLRTINFDFNEISMIIIGCAEGVEAISSNFLRQLEADRHIKAYIPDLEDENTMETIISVIQGERPINQQIEAQELDQDWQEILLGFDEQTNQD